MTLRKILPAALLLLAACAAPPAPTATESESVGMDSTSKKACCSTLTPEQKAACPMQKDACCEKDKAAAGTEAPKP